MGANTLINCTMAFLEVASDYERDVEGIAISMNMKIVSGHVFFESIFTLPS